MVDEEISNDDFYALLNVRREVRGAAVRSLRLPCGGVRARQANGRNDGAVSMSRRP